MIGLREKFHGCIAGSWVGSAMGAAVEGWPREKVEQTYGLLDRLVSYKHYTGWTDWQRLPGTTEDGIERQKLLATAIMEKGGRVTADDLIRVWLRDLSPERMTYKQEPFDRSLLELARAGVPPAELGGLWPFPNVVSLARSSHPLGLINAGDAESAADDCFEVGKVYMRQTSFGIRWACLYNAAIAEACSPGATVESVLATARRFAGYRAEAGSLYALYDTIQMEVDRALEIADRRSGDPAGMREEFYQHYCGGEYFNYGISQANEIVAKGLAVFALHRGNARDAIITAANFGRDTDCLAAVAGGLAGALGGPGDLPQQWLDQVNAATAADPYTHNRRTIEQTADGLFEAYLSRREKLSRFLRKMDHDGYLK